MDSAERRNDRGVLADRERKRKEEETRRGSRLGERNAGQK